MTAGTEVRIDALAWGGSGVGRLASGKVVMVAGSAPGDLLRVRITEERSSHSFAAIEEIVEPGERVDPACAVAGRCGGCGWQHVPVEAQRRWKRDLIAAEIARRGIGPADAIAPVVAGAPLGFRTRARLHRRGATTGFAAHASHEIVSFEGCPVMSAPLRDLAARLVAALVDAPPGDADLEIYVDAQGKSGIFVDELGRQPGSVQWEGLAAGIGVHALVVSHGGRRRAHPGGATLVEDSAGAAMEFEPGMFVQTNREMNAALVRTAVECAGEGRSLAEVYAGAGNFTVHLAGRFAGGTASEPDGPSARMLARNLAAARNVRVVREDDAATAKRLAAGKRVDLLFADPPRAGMKPLERVFASAPPGRVVLVSCHPMAAIRDMANMATNRYTLERVVPIDVFPQTPHLEIVAMLRR